MMTVHAQHARKKRRATVAPLFLRAAMVVALLAAPAFHSQVFGQTAAAVSGGGDQRVDENSAVTLNGIVSGGGVLTYEWAQVASDDAGAALVVGGFELTGSTGTPAANGAAMVTFNVSTATDRRGNGVRDLASDRYFFRLTGRSTTSGETTVATDTVAVTVYPPRALYVTGGYPSIDAREGDTFSVVLYRRDGVEPAAGIRLPFGAGAGPSRGPDCLAPKEGGSAPQDFRFDSGDSQLDGVIQPGDDSITRNYEVVDDNIPENTECLGFGFALHNNADRSSCCANNWIVENEEGFIQNARINDNDTITVGWQETAVTVGEGAGTVTLTAVITDPAAGGAIERDNFMLQYDTADGSAASPGDYTAVVSGMVELGADRRSVAVTVPIIDDSVMREFGETFTVRISTASVTPMLTAIGSATVTVTIDDNDFPTPVVGVTPNRANFSEGDTDAEFTITLTGGAFNSAVAVHFQVTGTAITTGDYDITLPAGIGAMNSMGTLTLMTHSTDTGANPVNGLVRLTITDDDDTVREDAETLEIAVWTDGSEVSRTSVTIAADPVADRFLSFGAATADGAEGAEMVIPVELTGIAPSGDVRVAITAAAGAGGANPAETGDYALLTPTLTFNATGTQNVRLRIEQDNVNESTETVLVSLGAIEADGGGGGTVSRSPDSVTVSIAQNDAITYSIAATPDPAVEDGEVRFTLSLSAPSEGDVSVALGASGGGMLNGRPSLVSAEFSGVPASVTVPAGASSTEFRVSLVDDSLVEAEESLGLLPGDITRTAQAGMVSAAGGAPIIRITDNDDAYYTIAAAENTAVEGGDARFIVNLVRQSGGGVVTAPGAVVVPWTAQVGAQGNTGDANTQAMPDLSGGTGAAGAALSGEVTIAAGQSTATITLSINSDSLEEAAETLTVTLGASPTLTAETGVVARSPDDNAAQVTIPENTAASRVLSVARASGAMRSEPLYEQDASRDDTGADLYELTMSIPGGGTSSEAVMVEWRVVTGAATANANPAEPAEDFNVVSGTATFAAGAADGATATVELQLAEDTLNEGAERFSIEWELNPANPDVALPPRLDGVIARSPSDTIALTLRTRIPANTACTVESSGGCASLTIGGPAGILVTDDITLSVTFDTTGGVGGDNSWSVVNPSDTVGMAEQTDGMVTVTSFGDVYNSAGQTLQFQVGPVADMFNESTQTIVVRFTGGESAGDVSVDGIGDISFIHVDDDATTVSVGDAPAANEGENAMFPVEFTGGIPTRDVEIDWEVVHGTTVDADFVSLTGTERIRIAFPTGLADAVTTGIVRVAIARDDDDEEDTFTLRLTGARGAGGSISVAAATSGTAVINRLDLSAPRFADPDEQPGWTGGQQVLWVKMNENIKVLASPSGAMASTDTASLTTLNAADFTVTENCCAPAMSAAAGIAVSAVAAFPDATNPALRLTLARAITGGAANVMVDYAHSGGNAIYDTALERGLAGPGGRNMTTGTSVLLPVLDAHLTADADGDGIPDAVEARISGDAGNPFVAVTDAQQPVLDIRRTASRNPVAYSGIRAHGVRAHLGVSTVGVSTTQTAAQTITAYYRSATFGYDGAYACASGQFPVNYAAPLADGGCAAVDWGDIRPGVNHTIAWLARSADGVWAVRTNTDSNLPEQVIQRIPELNMDAQSRYTTGMVVVSASFDSTPNEPLTLALSRTEQIGTGTRVTMFTATWNSGEDLTLMVTDTSAVSAVWEIAGLTAGVAGGGTSLLYVPAADAVNFPPVSWHSLGLVPRTQVTRINAPVPPILGRSWLVFSNNPGETTHVLRETNVQSLYVVVENLGDIGAGGSVAVSHDGALSSAAAAGTQRFLDSLNAYEIILTVGGNLLPTTNTAVIRVAVTGGFGGVTTATYRFPITAPTAPLAATAARGNDEDNDGIIDAIDAFDDSDHLPVVVDETAGASAWHHIRPALPLHDLRLGEMTFRRLAMATMNDQVDEYAEYSASETPPSTSNLAVVYDFEIGGVDYAEVTSDSRTGGAAGVIIPLPRDLYDSGASLVKYPSDVAFSVEGDNDYGFAQLQEDGACPDDTMTAGSPYREGETLRRAKRGGDACLVVYIVDGGANDEDGVANGIIKDPLGVRAGNAAAGGGSRSHSGAFGPVALAALSALLLLLALKSPRRARRRTA